MDLNLIEKNTKEIIKAVGENTEREGLIKTPHRVAKSFAYIFGGYEENPEEILNSALFKTSNNQMVLVKNIEFYSMCEHHLLPFFGEVSVAYIPDGKVVGLSKIPRIVKVFSRRMQIQEQLTEQIAEVIEKVIKPKGVGVRVKARHMCMEMRGIESKKSYTVTSALRGQFFEERTRNEFFHLVEN